MPTESSTDRASRHTSSSLFTVRDGRVGRYGLIFLDDLDTEEFRNLKGSAIRVYLTLLPFAAKGEGTAYPKQSTIARITGLHPVTVCKAITELCDAGFLKKNVLGHRPDRLVYTILRPPSRRPESQ